jgi:hypothetical protein
VYEAVESFPYAWQRSYSSHVWSEESDANFTSFFSIT